MKNKNTKQNRNKRMAEGVAMLGVLVVGILDSIASAMPFWWLVVISLGFLGFLGLPLIPIIYVVLSFCRSRHLLEVCDGSTNYIVVRIFSFVIGQIIGFAVFLCLPLTPASLDNAGVLTMLLCCAACMLVTLVVAWALKKEVEQKSL